MHACAWQEQKAYRHSWPDLCHEWTKCYQQDEFIDNQCYGTNWCNSHNFSQCKSFVVLCTYKFLMWKHFLLGWWKYAPSWHLQKHVTSHIGRGANANTCHGNSLRVLCSITTTCSRAQLRFLGGFSTSSWHHYSNSRRMLHSITAAAM